MVSTIGNRPEAVSSGVMTPELQALRISVTGLAELVTTLDAGSLTEAAYPRDWTIADTLSHLGSGAVIMASVLEWTLEGQVIPNDFMAGIWDEWNAKTPTAQAAEAVVADASLLAALEAVPAEQAASVKIAMGDQELEFATFLAHRLDEHVVHTWDVAVALDPAATLSAAVTPVVLDGLPPVVEHGGRPVDDEREIIVDTFDPLRSFRLELGPDAVLLEPEARPDRSLPEVHLPAEAFIRLVHGRLDPDHTPHGVGGSADVDELRRVFPGF